jgi:hypothetical protein
MNPKHASQPCCCKIYFITVLPSTSRSSYWSSPSDSLAKTLCFLCYLSCFLHTQFVSDSLLWIHLEVNTSHEALHCVAFLHLHIISSLLGASISFGAALRHSQYIRFQVFTAIAMKNAVFWGIKPMLQRNVSPPSSG